MTFFELQSKFPTEQSVIQHFIHIRYGGGACCLHCGSVKVYPKHTEPKNFYCNDCHNTFSVFKDTIFEKSSTSLVKWMYAIHLFLNGKKGVSGLQLMREIGVTYKTAWRMLKQIRLAMGNSETKQIFEAIVEMDETYVGGKPRKGNTGRNDTEGEEQPKNKRGRGTKKTPVVAVVERSENKVHAKVALPDQDGKKLSGKNLLQVLKEITQEGTTVITDEFRAYNILKSTNYVHLKVDHTRMFADGFVHTNNVESFWAVLKRGLYGIYHQVSPKYLQSYVDEFCFRHNNRRNPEVFDCLLKRCIK